LPAVAPEIRNYGEKIFEAILRNSVPAVGACLFPFVPLHGTPAATKTFAGMTCQVTASTSHFNRGCKMIKRVGLAMEVS
jgi:hypothetical protein